MKKYDKKPIKRVEELRYLSHDHHHGLLLCWKINTGLKKDISVNRIEKYLHWFFKNYLKHHFKVEEDVVFTVLGSEHPEIIHALEDHKILASLFEKEGKTVEDIKSIARLLKAHIRFEERVIFELVQQKASEKELLLIKQSNDGDKFIENEDDTFWL